MQSLLQSQHLMEVNAQLQKLLTQLERDCTETLQEVSLLEQHNGQLRNVVIAALKTRRPEAEFLPTPEVQHQLPKSLEAKDLVSERAPPRTARTMLSKASATSDATDMLGWTDATTTVLIQNIPSRCTRAELLAAFPPDGSYNFLYLPYSVKQRRTAGFVILNFVSPVAALNFKQVTQGRPLPKSQRPCKPLVVLPSMVQGFLANVGLAADKFDKEQNSDAYAPMAFCTGREALEVAALYPHCVSAEDVAVFDFHALARVTSSRSV